jgi:hypothetical protein
MKTLTEVMEASYEAARAFQAALDAAGFKSRWHWHVRHISSDRTSAIVSAYHAKVAADAEMHEAFAKSRNTEVK